MKVNAFFIIIFLLISCGNDNETTVTVVSKHIENFSSINYKEDPEVPYFSEIHQLPHGFSLGGFNDSNSILSLIESANIFPFDDENLKYFITNEELELAFETYVDSSFVEPELRKIQFYPYERLVTKNFVLLIINKRTNIAKGRDYQFDVRTYTFDGKLISSITLAKWDDEHETYFSGWIMPDMTVKRNYEGKKVEFFEILDNGEIKSKMH